jgi:hypothetical protein
MSKIIFFRQRRADGGVHSGVETEEHKADFYQEGAGEYNPALEWFVDLRVEGKDLPPDLQEAIEWLTAQGKIISLAFEQLSRELAAGIDFGSWPLEWPVPQAPQGVEMSIISSCVQRVSARDLSCILEQIASNWSRYLTEISSAITPTVQG